MNIIRIKKMLVALLVGALLVVNNPVLAIAQEAPTPPTAPTAPTPPPSPDDPPTAPDAPTAPTPPPSPDDPPTAPDAPTAPTPPPSPDDPPTAPDVPSDTGSESDSTANSGDSSTDSSTTSDSGGESSSQTGSQEESSSTLVNDEGTGHQSEDSGLGGASIVTGDATTTGTIENDANDNLSGKSAGVVEDGGGISVVNDGNGVDSENTGSATIVSGDTTTQENGATIVNNMGLSTTTGENSASKNLGDTSIITGDANTTGTLINTVNTNVDGVMAYEFNIADDYNGDYILDFSDVNCVSGCTTDVMVANVDNGSDSINTASADILTNDETFQTNDANIENNMILVADSGDNRSDRNNDGSNYIETGDANVSANVLNFANNNIAGGVIYGVVNIFGDLVGDIIFPEGVCCFGSALAINSDNGADSTNTTNVNLASSDTTNQFNEAIIDNNLTFSADSGDNDTSRNNQGDNEITTGDTSIDAQVVNIANTNIDGGDYWLVLVNEAGKWLGQIFGADGKNYSGSYGFEFIVGEDGQITVANSGNADGSVNTATVNIENNSLVDQSNTANIVNNIDLSANTGGNSASRNNLGDNEIVTGDATVLANIVNFVNNNIVGGGRLFVNVINVFGSWTGNFVGPGYERSAIANSNDSNNDRALGGYQEASVSQDNGSDGSESSGDSNNESQVAAAVIIGDSASVSVTPTATVVTASEAGDRMASAAIIDQIEATASDSENININLAWLLILIPGYFVFVGLGKKALVFARR